jgi:hypothetical protein
MCYPIKCNVCNKIAWGGCGAHVERLKCQIPIEQRCMHVKWD